MTFEELKVRVISQNPTLGTATQISLPTDKFWKAMELAYNTGKLKPKSPLYDIPDFLKGLFTE